MVSERSSLEAFETEHYPALTLRPKSCQGIFAAKCQRGERRLQVAGIHIESPSTTRLVTALYLVQLSLDPSIST